MVHYTASQGVPEVCQTIAEKLQRENGITVDPAGEVMLTAGVKSGVFNIMQALINPGEEVLLPDPCWLDYLHIIRMAGGVPVAVPLREENGFQMDPVEVERLITPRTKMLVVITPHNPTGNVTSKATLQALSDLAVRHNLLVISDEIYEKLIYDGLTHYSLATFPEMAERTLTVNGFSKAYAMDGWRLGYIAGPRALMQQILKVQMYSVANMTSFAQMGAVAAYRGPQDCVAQMVTEFDRRRQMMLAKMATIDGLKVHRPEGAFYFFPNITAFGLSSTDMATYLLKEAGLATVPGSAFGTWGEGFIRMAYSDSYENLSEAMDQLKAALEKLGR
jgi:aspartate/methionine/tyrosine aminotransferase